MMRWSEIAIDAGLGAMDAVGAALLDAGCAGIEIRDHSDPKAVVGYLPVDDRLEARLEGLQQRLRSLPQFGIVDASDELTVRTVQEEDWANGWKAFFKPMRVGNRLVVTPPWEHPELGANDIPLIIDPGMAFGTGSHPTTQLCLAALEEWVRPGFAVADIGTGSGILAIAAAKLGAGLVVATDIEPPSVQIAAENARVACVVVTTQTGFPDGCFDLIVANILADVIIELRANLLSRLAPQGILIVSGIIDTRETDVKDALAFPELTLLHINRQAEWIAMVFRRQSA